MWRRRRRDEIAALEVAAICREPRRAEKLAVVFLLRLTRKELGNKAVTLAKFQPFSFPGAGDFLGDHFRGADMRKAHAKYLKSHLLQSVAVLIAAAASMNAAQAQTQTIATPTNVNVTRLLNPFTTRLGPPTIAQNFTSAVSVNNNSTAFQHSQSIIDNTITTDNGVVLSDALGSKMFTIWNSVNSQASNGSTVTFSNNLLTLFRQINAISQDDSGKAKNWLADGSANGSVFVNNNNLALGKTATSNTAITNASLPAGGTFNVYDKAYNPPPWTANRTGHSRPIQVASNNIAMFSAPTYFGVVQSNGAIAGGVNGNVATGLFANAAAPSGHTTFGYVTSILF